MKTGRVVLVVIMLLLLLGIGAGYSWWKKVTGKVFVGQVGNTQTTKNTVLKAEKSPAKKFEEDKTPLNILLLGYGGGTHDGTYLTDSIMIIHLDPEKVRATLISIPRDLWVNTADAGSASAYEKINAAYSDGVEIGGAIKGGEFVKRVTKNVTGLDINYFVAVDFSGFKNTIDTLGGVDVKVDVAFDDPQYPVEGKENDLCGKNQTELAQITATASATTDPQNIFPCRYENLHFDVGTVHMDGTTALKYVRSRHSIQDGNDFGRSRRQRNLLVAVKQKIMAINFIPKAIPFITSLGDDVKTDLTPDDVRMLAQSATTLSKFYITNLALTDANYLVDTFSEDQQAILQPKLGRDNFSEIQKWITGELAQANPPTPAIVLVENGTQKAGLAQTANRNIQKREMQTLAPKNADDQTVLKTRVIIYDDNLDAKNLADLKQELSVTNIEKATNPAGDFNVLVILGADYNPQ